MLVVQSTLPKQSYCATLFSHIFDNLTFRTVNIFWVTFISVRCNWCICRWMRLYVAQNHHLLPQIHKKLMDLQSKPNFTWVASMGAEPFSKWGGTSPSQKNCRKIFWFELGTVTSQALNYDVINFQFYAMFYKPSTPCIYSTPYPGA